MVLLVQRVQDLVFFKGFNLVKANLTTSLRVMFLEWYTSKLEESDYDNLKKTPSMKKWIKKLTIRFKIPIDVALGLLVDEEYTLSDA